MVIEAKAEDSSGTKRADTKSLCWGSKRLRTSGNDIKLARTPGSASISSGAVSGDHLHPGGGDIDGEDPGQPALRRTPEQMVPAERASSSHEKRGDVLGDQTPSNASPKGSLDISASPAAAELLMALCHAISESTVTEDKTIGATAATGSDVEEKEKEESVSPRATLGQRQSNGGRTRRASAQGLLPPNQVKFQYRFGPGQPAGGATNGRRNGTATRQKSCAFVGVRKRQWGTYAAEIRNQNSGSREWLGTFETAEEAAVVYDMRLRQIKGPGAKCNFPPLYMSDKLSECTTSRRRLESIVSFDSCLTPACLHDGGSLTITFCFFSSHLACVLAVKREICPHGKSSPHRLTLMIPENWLQQVVALRDGGWRPTPELQPPPPPPNESPVADAVTLSTEIKNEERLNSAEQEKTEKRCG